MDRLKARLVVSRRRRLRFALFLVLSVGVSLAAGVAAARSYTNFNWISSVTFEVNGGSGGQVGTDGWAARDHIQVWRPAGDGAYLAYENTSNAVTAWTINSTANPYYWSQSSSYGKAFCGPPQPGSNESPWTCQTTTP